MKLYLLIFSFALVFSVSPAHAIKTVATLVYAKGDVKIFRDRKQVKKGKAKTLLYEGKVFAYKKGRIGAKIRGDDIVHCGPNGKAKLVFANGDHLAISPGSSVQIPPEIKGGKQKRPTLNIFYGKMRALISKKGPRRGLKIRTKSAVAGVRGTDFFIKDTGVLGTNVTVLRGKVSIAMSEKKNRSKVVRETTVSAGYSAKVKGSFAKKSSGLPQKVPEIEIQEASKTDLLNIQKASRMKLEQKELEENPEVKKEIETLQKKAAKAVLLDIKEEDEKLYEKLKKENIESADELNTAVVSKLYKLAPKDVKAKKPSEDDVRDLGGDEIYNKYFKSN